MLAAVQRPERLEDGEDVNLGIGYMNTINTFYFQHPY